MIQAFGLTSNSRKDLPPAVDDVSFEAPAGRVTALLGDPGAGKTTALRLMLELQPGRGITYFRGHPLHRIAQPSREVGVLLGDVPGHPGRTVRGHLRMLCAAAGVSARRADEVLEVVGLVSLRDEHLGTLSRGMDRRLGLACALLPDPHTLVLDEPVNGLSARESNWLYGMLRAHAAQGGTVLVTTSDPKEAARTADRVVTLERGRVVADQEAADFARTRLRPRVAVHSPHAARLAAALTKEARTAHRSVEVVVESGNRLSVYGSTCADVGETAFRHGVLVLKLADEVGDMGPGAGAAPPREPQPARATSGPHAATATASEAVDKATTGAATTDKDTAGESTTSPIPAPSDTTPPAADSDATTDRQPHADHKPLGDPHPPADPPPHASHQSPTGPKPPTHAETPTDPKTPADPKPSKNHKAPTDHKSPPESAANHPRPPVRPLESLPPLPPPISVRPAPSPLRPLRYELRRATGISTGFVTCAAVLVVSALTAVVLARIGHTPQARLFAAWPQQLPLPPAALGAGLLGALAFGDEFRHPALAADRGTVPRRLGLLTAKLLLAAATAIALAVLTVGCDAEVLYLIYGRELAQVPGDWLSLSASWLGLMVGCAWAGVLAAGVFRSTTAGLAAVLAVPILVVPLVQKVVEGSSVRTAAGLPMRMRQVFLLQWPFGGERYLEAAARVVAQPVGSALTLSLTALLCAYLFTTLRSRVR
ncbi:ATP-binding cassette domain-containing protein [Streptomyces sp. TRM70350]|uniref:ABC transporter ATP-binding protein n=1 Tax=Streptomyces sp. TRM70350 TaxID=2856165 RepID=UPI001C461806|nr:ABC transporter ATP-binding protein [Streptomyces sp. TRM70350]MBV7700306.1 ATP-binding cassette domain-containing protein [Streptomyces sp. TRM70350]